MDNIKDLLASGRLNLNSMTAMKPRLMSGSMRVEERMEGEKEACYDCECLACLLNLIMPASAPTLIKAL